LRASGAAAISFKRRLERQRTELVPQAHGEPHLSQPPIDHYREQTAIMVIKVIKKMLNLSVLA
jgi:hypothetical protein